MHSETSSFSREIDRHFNSYFEEFELATSYVDLLLILQSKKDISQNDLALEMNLAPSTITRFVNKLVKKNLVKKKKVGRTAVIELSQKGKTLAPRLEKSFNRAVADLRDILGDKYVHTTKQLLLHGTDLLKK